MSATTPRSSKRPQFIRDSARTGTSFLYTTRIQLAYTMVVRFEHECWVETSRLEFHAHTPAHPASPPHRPQPPKWVIVRCVANHDTMRIFLACVVRRPTHPGAGVGGRVEAAAEVARWPRRLRGDGSSPAGERYMVPPGEGPRSSGGAGRAGPGAARERGAGCRGRPVHPPPPPRSLSVAERCVFWPLLPYRPAHAHAISRTRSPPLIDPLPPVPIGQLCESLSAFKYHGRLCFRLKTKFNGDDNPVLKKRTKRGQNRRCGIMNISLDMAISTSPSHLFPRTHFKPSFEPPPLSYPGHYSP